MRLRARIRADLRTGALCLMLPLVVLAQQQPPPDLKIARSQMDSGQIAAADVTLQSLLLRNPRDAEAWIQLGSLQARLRRFADAEISLRRATSLQPTNARAHYTLGLLLVVNPREKLDWPGAIQEFQTAIRLQTDYSDAFTYLGAGLLATGRPGEAIEALQKAISADAGNATAFFNLALALESAGRNPEAAHAYEQAIRIRKTYPEASSALGKLDEKIGDHAAAEQQLRAALRINPDLQDAHQALGRVLRATHRTDQAKVEFALAAALGQREPDAIAASQLSNAGLKQAADGHMAEAAATLRRALALRPDSGVAHNNLGLLLADLGDRNGAIRELSIAISLMPAQGRPYFDLGRILQLDDRQAEAASCLRWAAQFPPVDTRLQAALLKLPPATLAGATTRPHFGAESDSAPDHMAFAAELHQQGDLTGEAGELLHALSLNPASISARLQLVEAYRLLNQPLQSSLEAAKVLLVDPGNAEAARFRLAPAPAGAERPETFQDQ